MAGDTRSQSAIMRGVPPRRPSSMQSPTAASRVSPPASVSSALRTSFSGAPRTGRTCSTASLDTSARAIAPDGGWCRTTRRARRASWKATVPSTRGSCRQNPAGLFRHMGGVARAARRLDRFFRKLNAGPGAPYAYLGNEPTLAVPWLYDWLGRPARTTDVVHRALLDLYAPTPDGMPGNDDGGAMSAWWVLGAIGLYPAVPGADLLALNGPLFPHATISLPHGRLTIDAEGVGNRTRYVQSARFDGSVLDRSWLDFSSISHGRHQLLVRMGASSRSAWATSSRSRPPSGLRDPAAS